MPLLLDLFLTFLKIGAFTFGGGYAMLALLDRECVEKKGWLTRQQLLDLTVVAESTPGPVAINCATYTGYQRAGFWGALISTVGMVLPSFVLLYLISRFFENLLSVTLIANAFRGIRVAVAVLILQAAVKLLRQLLEKSPEKKLQAVLIAVFFAAVLACDLLGLRLSTIWLILAGGILGFCLFYLPKSKRGEDGT